MFNEEEGFYFEIPCKTHALVLSVGLGDVHKHRQEIIDIITPTLEESIKGGHTTIIFDNIACTGGSDKNRFYKVKYNNLNVQSAALSAYVTEKEIPCVVKNCINKYLSGVAKGVK